MKAERRGAWKDQCGVLRLFQKSGNPAGARGPRPPERGKECSLDVMGLLHSWPCSGHGLPAKDQAPKHSDTEVGGAHESLP